MSKLFAPLFEWNFFYVDPYSEIMFDGPGYTFLGFAFLLVPLVVMFSFYYLWNPVFGRWYHWLLMVCLAGVLTLGASYGIISEQIVEFLSDSEYPDSNGYLWRTAVLASFYALLTAVIWSFIIRMWSKNNRTNPLSF